LAAIEPWLRDVAERPQGGAPSPFFLFFHLFEPHSPYAPPEPYASRFEHAYDGEIAAADQVVGQLFDLLRELGVYREALIVLFSDHGEGLGDHGEEEHGLFLYREALEVPLIFKLPGNERAGETVRGPAQLVDVYPTVLDVLELEVPNSLAGTSLLRLDDAARPLYAETFYPRLHFGWSELRSVMLGSWHLIDGPDSELFDLKADGAERRNLLSSEERTATLLSRHLDPHRGGLTPPAIVDRETRSRLAALGYLGGSVQVPAGPLPDPKAQIPTLKALREARRYVDAQDPEAALRVYRRVLRENPRLLDGWIAVSDLLRRQGRLEDALRALRRALEVSGGDPYLFGDIALLEAGLGHLEEARVAMEAAAAAGVPVVAMRLRLAQVLAQGGHLKEAAAELQPLASEEVPAAMNALARVYSEAGDQQAAQGLLVGVLEGDPKNSEAHEHLGLVALRRGDWASAHASSKRALDLDAERPEAWNNLGVALLQLGEPSKALEAWKKAVTLDPQLYDTLYNLGMQAVELGHPELARSTLRRFVAGAPPVRYAEELRRVRVILRRLGD
jgi:tetratricopeptide (TPR) repeat protein